MITKPQHLWKLNEGQGTVALDSAGSDNGKYSPTVKPVKVIPYRLGAVHIDGTDGSFVTFGNQVGQFGATDFTVALWFKTSETYRYFDILGNRIAGSHGNFFSIRMTGRHESWPQGMIQTEIDDNGKNYIAVKSTRTGLNDGQWHHLAVVRNGISLKLYIDGLPSGQATAFGVACISNGNDFRLGRSLQGVHDKFAPDAEYHTIYMFDTALSDADILSLVPRKPAHQWKLNEKSDHLALDSAGDIAGLLSPAVTHVPGGPFNDWVVNFDKSDHSLIDFSDKVGQFGINDFSVSFWINTKEVSLPLFDIVGNRTCGSHGNFFSIRMTGKHESLPAGQVISEVDDNNQNYIHVESNKTGLNDGMWHLVAVVRKANSLWLYINGGLSDEDKAQGVANISNGNRFNLGRSLKDPSPRFSPEAQYSDLRVYNFALTEEEVLSLIPIP